MILPKNIDKLFNLVIMNVNFNQRNVHHYPLIIPNKITVIPISSHR